jgi:hypothetical protein
MTTTSKTETIKQILEITKTNPEIIETNPIYEKSTEYLEKLLKVVKLLPK